MQLSERITATGIALTAIGANVAIGQGKSELLMALPALFAALICYVAYINSEVFALGGYVAVLETAIERRLGHPLLIWESQVAPQRHASAPRLVFRIYLGGMWTALTCAAIWQAVQTRDQDAWGHDASCFLIATTLVSIILSLIAMVASMRGSVAERDKTMAITRRALGL